MPRTTASEIHRYKANATEKAHPGPARLAASLEQFIGHPAYGLQQLREDLERFVFLLGGSDGEPLFGPPRLT